MKKILIIFLISIINLFAQSADAAGKINTPQEQEAVLNCQRGDKIVNYFETKTDRTNPNRYLNAAKYYYYQASRLDLSNSDSLIGIARIALLQDKLTDAKNVLMIALNFDENNPKTNFYLGETFYRDGEFTHAIDYFNKAYQNGYNQDFSTNYRLGVCYEKLDDAQKAKEHFLNAQAIRPSSEEVKDHLQGLEKINIKQSSHSEEAE